LYIIDGHCDTLCDVADGLRDLRTRSNKGHLDLERLRIAGVKGQIFALYTDDNYITDGALPRTLKLISAFLKELDKSDQMVHVKCPGDAAKAYELNKIACFLSIEGGEALNGDLDMLRVFYEIGVRLMGITWNRKNQLASGVGDGVLDEGLTPFGKTVIAEMNRLGMVIDISHISEKGFWDIIDITESPIIASHSNSRKLADHPRNLTDEQAKIIADNGGVIGVTLVKPFLGNSRGNIRGVVEHIDHFVNLLGDDHVSIGCDFDGISDELLPDGIKDVTDIKKIVEELVSMGYEDSSIEKIMGLNLLRVIEEVMSKGVLI